MQQLFLKLCLRMPIRRRRGSSWREFNNFVRESNAGNGPPMQYVSCIHKRHYHHILLFHMLWPTLFFFCIRTAGKEGNGKDVCGCNR